MSRKPLARLYVVGLVALLAVSSVLAGQVHSWPIAVHAAAPACPTPPAQHATGPYPHLIRLLYLTDSMAVSEATRHVFAIASTPQTNVARPSCVGQVVMLDGTSGKPLSTVRVGEQPSNPVVSDQASRLVLLNGGNRDHPANSQGSVSFIETHSGHLITTIPLGLIPLGSTLDEPAGTVLVLVGPARADPSALKTTGLKVLALNTGKVVGSEQVAMFDIEINAHNGLVIGANATTFYVLDGKSGKVLKTVPAPKGCKLNGPMLFDPTGKLIVGAAHQICVLDTTTWSVLKTLKEGNSRCTGSLYDAASSRLYGSYSGGKEEDGYVCIEDLATSRSTTIDLGGGVEISYFLLLGNTGLTASGEGVYVNGTNNMVIRDAVTGKEVRRIKVDGVESTVAYDSKTGMMLTVGRGGFRVIDPRTGKNMRTAKGPNQLLSPMKLIQSTRRVFATSGNGTMTIFCADARC